MELSSDPIELGEERKVEKSTETVHIELDITIGSYVVCMYDDLKYLGLVLSNNEEFDDFEIDFLYPSGLNQNYFFPQRKDKCFVSKDKIMGVLNTPSLRPGTSRIQYVFRKDDLMQYFQ